MGHIQNMHAGRILETRIPVGKHVQLPAARMLDLLGARTIRLMTNNPRKVAALEAAGITVSERVPHQLPDNPHNARYLATKRDKSGPILT